jgi:hypothetical protein
MRPVMASGGTIAIIRLSAVAVKSAVASPNCTLLAVLNPAPSTRDLGAGHTLARRKAGDRRRAFQGGLHPKPQRQAARPIPHLPEPRARKPIPDNLRYGLHDQLGRQWCICVTNKLPNQTQFLLAGNGVILGEFTPLDPQPGCPQLRHLLPDRRDRHQRIVVPCVNNSFCSRATGDNSPAICRGACT